MPMGNLLSKYVISEEREKDQGGLNPEFTFTNRELKLRWKACDRNPGHKPFIPVTQFRKEHLPSKYQTDKVYNSVKATSDLTVRIVVGFTSEDRPLGDSNYVMRGKKFGRYASGFVYRVERLKSQDLCLCQGCQKSAESEKQRVAARVLVRTASHAVFDNSEVAATVAELFYDDDRDRQGVKTLYGSKIIDRDIPGDWCMFECLTHDEELAEKLSQKIQELRDLEKQLEHEFLESRSQVELAVVASHPHGGPKQISIGELKRVENGKASSKDKVISVRPPVSVAFEEDAVIFTMTFRGDDFPPMVNKQPDSEPCGIEVTVKYPDKTEEGSMIWQLGRPVKETKAWMLNTGGIQEPPENFTMIMELPGEKEVEMNDDTKINYYWDDLTQALKISFRKRK